MRISKIQESDNESVVEILAINFGFIDTKEEILKKIKPRLNNNLSIKVEVDGKIVGCYLLAEKSINFFFEQINKDQLKDFPKDQTQIYLKQNFSDHGLQGISLAVLPQYKSRGIGKVLKEYTYKLGYDYIWGVQDKKLQNIDFWKNSREVVAESKTHYATLRSKNTIKESFENNVNNAEELFLDLQDHLETSLELMSDIEVSSKSGWATDMTTSVVKVARNPNEKKCVELKVEYPIPTRIFTNFSDFSKSNKNLVELDKEMLSMLKKIKRMGIEYGVKKYLSEGRLVYIIRGFVPQELDDKSKERIKGLDIKKRMIEYFEGLTRQSRFNFATPIYTFRAGKLHVGDFHIIKPENQRSRGNWSYYLNAQETLQVLDDLIQQEANNPEFRIQKKRGGGIGLVISLKD